MNTPSSFRIVKRRLLRCRCNRRVCPCGPPCALFTGSPSEYPTVGIWAGFEPLCGETGIRRKKSRRKDRGRKRPCPSHKCPQCGHFQGFVTGDRGTLLSGICTLWNAPSSSFLSVFKGFRRRSTGPKPYFDPNFGPILRSKSAEEFSSYFRKSVVVVCVAKRK